MTRWLAAAKQVKEAGTKLTEPTESRRNEVLSVVSVLSEGRKALDGTPPALFEVNARLTLSRLVGAYHDALPLAERRNMVAGMLQAMKLALGERDAIRRADMAFRDVTSDQADRAGLYRGQLAWLVAAQRLVQAAEDGTARPPEAQP